MTIETNITNRRELAGALAQYMNTRAVYLGPPTFAYQIGDIHLSREGILSGDDLDGIFPFLEMQGIITAQPMQFCKLCILMLLRYFEDSSLPIVIRLFRNAILLAPMLDTFSAAAAI